MNRDPLQEEGGVNLYAMVGNNPINDMDEYGEVGIKNPYPVFVNWVNGFLTPPKVNSTSDEAGADDWAAAQNVGGAKEHAQKTGAKSWKVGAEVVMAVAPVPVPRGFTSASNIAHQAHNAANYARYLNHHRQIQKYGQAGFKTLKNGRILYFGKLKPAKTAGEMAGMRVVREWNPLTGRHRTWMQTLDHAGRVRQIRPQTGNIKVHYRFDIHGKYIGKW